MPSAKELYRQLCVQHDIPLFAQDWWLDIACKDWNAIVVHNGAKPAATWAYPVEKKLGLTMSRLPALTPYLGPTILYPPDMRAGKRDGFEHDMIKEALDNFPDFHVVETALMPGVKQAGIFKAHGFGIAARQTFIVDLDRSETELLANMHEDTRRNIARASKEIEITEDPEALKDLYNFQKTTLDRKEVGIPYSPEKLQRLFDACSARNCTALWVARKEGVVQAVLWNMWDQRRSYYLVGAKNPDVKDTRAVTGLIWHALLHCKALGKITFDFEGSMIPGVERFFRTFGPRRELYLVLQKNRSLFWKALTTLR